MVGFAASRRAWVGGCFCLAAALAGCASGAPSPPRLAGEGVASWYGDDFHGKTTTSGDRYNMYRLTAASRDLPLGTILRVTRQDTGRSVEVLVNDRGPFVAGRILDLSYEAARRLDMLETGVATVRLEILSGPGLPSGTPGGGTPATGTAGVAAPPATTAAGTGPAAGTASPGAWWVSLGAFTLERNAVWLRDRIAPHLPGAAVVRRGSRQDSLYQVRIGPHPDREAAERTARMLMNLGLRGSTAGE